MNVTQTRNANTRFITIRLGNFDHCIMIDDGKSPEQALIEHAEKLERKAAQMVRNAKMARNAAALLAGHEAKPQEEY